MEEIIGGVLDFVLEVTELDENFKFAKTKENPLKYKKEKSCYLSYLLKSKRIFPRYFFVQKYRVKSLTNIKSNLEMIVLVIKERFSKYSCVHKLSSPL